MCTPARSKATRSRASSGADCHVWSCAVVFATNRRRRCFCSCRGSPRRPAGAPDSAHTGGSRRPPPCARRRADSTGRCAPGPWNVGSGTSRRETATLRPPSTTWLGTVPARADAHTEDRTAPCDPPPASRRARGGPSGPSTRRVRPSCRPGVQRAAGTGRREIQQQRSAMLDFSWRLLVGELAPAAPHHSCTTSSEEPPLSNFNSQWDIPLRGRRGRTHPVEEG